MGCAAEIIALEEVRASRQHQALRQKLHERFDHWLDALESQLPEKPATLAQVSETIWALRQPLTASVAQAIVEHTHHVEQHRDSLKCATCDRLLPARPAVPRTIETLIGAIEVTRPSCYCRHCHQGRYPLDDRLGLRTGRMQLGVQQAAVELAME